MENKQVLNLFTVPTTNLRIVVGLVLAVLFIFFLFAAMVLQIKLEEKLVEVVAWFIFGMLGVDAVQFIGKRATTHKTEPKSESETNTGEPIGYDKGA